MNERQMKMILYGLLMGLTSATPVELVRKWFDETSKDESLWKAFAESQAIRADPEAVDRLMQTMITDEVRTELEKSIGREK